MPSSETQRQLSYCSGGKGKGKLQKIWLRKVGAIERCPWEKSLTRRGRFSKVPRTFRARKLFGAVFRHGSRVPQSVSQKVPECPVFFGEVFGICSWLVVYKAHAINCRYPVLASNFGSMNLLLDKFFSFICHSVLWRTCCTCIYTE